MRSLRTIRASNFLNLRDVSLDLQDLTVLVGPNGVGKSNLLRVIQFLGDTARLDLGPAIERHGGYDRILFRGQHSGRLNQVKLGITAQITANASPSALDEYDLSFWRSSPSPTSVSQVRLLRRREKFVFKRTQGRGRRITIEGNKVELTWDDASTTSRSSGQKPLPLTATSTGLSTLPRLGKEYGGEQIGLLAELFSTFRVFEIDASRARAPSKYAVESAPRLESDASNLSSFLRWLSLHHKEVFQLLEEDLRYIVPSIKKIHFRKLSGTDDSTFAVQLAEKGLADYTLLGEASFGTIRALALLAMLHDPSPPKLTCVEEIDHGLHPHALDRVVERLRSATRRTQLLVVTHSPALANRLEPNELVVCEREPESGSARIPAINASKIAAMAKESGLLPGELWFTGALGGAL